MTVQESPHHSEGKISGFGDFSSEKCVCANRAITPRFGRFGEALHIIKTCWKQIFDFLLQKKVLGDQRGSVGRENPDPEPQPLQDRPEAKIFGFG